MYTVKHAAHLVGVTVATLRAWDRRHGIGPSSRTEAGYRLYDDAAVERLRTMKSLVDSGWAVGLAAAEARTLAGTVRPYDSPASPTAPVRVTGPASSVDDLVTYAESFDARGLATTLDDHFGNGSFEPMVDDWLLPALQQVGLAWAQGRVSVAGEHFVSHAVTRRLAASYDAAGESLTGPQVAVGMPPGSRHDLGLLCFATAAKRAGVATRYLGTDVPLADWEDAIVSPDVLGAVLAVPRTEDVTQASRTVASLRRVRPDLAIFCGGAHQDQMPEGVVQLGHGIGPGVRALARRLSTR